MLTRRASKADRLALRVALDSAGTEPLPTIFASRHGEVHRSVELLSVLTSSEPTSPMSFSLSVHNAAAGFFSLGRADSSASSSVAAGRDSVPMALLEAAAQLAEGRPRVLVVAYDERIPSAFRPYLDEADFGGALAMLLERDGAEQFSLELLSGVGMDTMNVDTPQLPLLARFLATPAARELCVVNERRGWRWLRSN